MATNEQQHQLTSIKLVSDCFVKPKYEVEAAKQPYHLGPADLIMLTIDPIQKGLLYTLDHTKSSDIVIDHSSRAKVVSHLVEKLKHSLSIALVHFYPLAGRFSTRTYTDENACSIFVDCNKGPGARFIHATALDFKVCDIDLSLIDVTIVHPLFELGEKYLNYDGLTRALLSIQVTELADAVFIGFSMNHSVVDGTSFVHFINMLSEIFRANDSSSSSIINQGKMNNISRVPIMNYRPWLSSNEEMMIKFPVLDLEKLMIRGYDHGPLRESIFRFSPSSMAKLKAKANEECGTHSLVSSFQALTALVWRSITRARNLPLDQTTSCFIVVGARSRFERPISDDYFGSFLSKAQWDCKVEELLSNNLGRIAMNLREAILASNDGKKVIDLYKKLMNAPSVNPRGSSPNPLGESGLIMGGSARFDLYGPEFGLGRALAARMGYGNKEDGKITASPGCEGGSVDLEICLRPWVMKVLNDDQEFMSFVSLN